ncbi:MAG TPA: hypothetical protein VF834_20170, partial [Streptosporangiaceae bacterium]
MHAHLSDLRQKIGFADQRWFHVEEPATVLEEGDGAIYLAFGGGTPGAASPSCKAGTRSPSEPQGNK